MMLNSIRIVGGQLRNNGGFGRVLASATQLHHAHLRANVPFIASFHASTTVEKEKESDQTCRHAFKPTIADAKAMPREMYEFPNDALITLAANGSFDAREERLIREIMAVDEIEWDTARKVADQVYATTRKSFFISTLPYKIGIFVGITGAFVSIPLCFHLPTVTWFNEVYVTTEVPPPEDLETVLECGSWAWNWMEPPLGAISFVLLALQFSRAQMQNIGIAPFTEMMKGMRARRLCRAFPNYNPTIVKDYSDAVDLTPNI